MYETEFQTYISDTIIEQETSGVSASITDNENAVIVELDNGEDAAFTAEETRELASSIKCVSVQRWEEDAIHLVNYLNDLADVVDNEKTVEEVRKKWQEKGVL